MTLLKEIIYSGGYKGGWEEEREGTCEYTHRSQPEEENATRALTHPDGTPRHGRTRSCPSPAEKTKKKLSPYSSADSEKTSLSPGKRLKDDSVQHLRQVVIWHFVHLLLSHFRCSNLRQKSHLTLGPFCIGGAWSQVGLISSASFVEASEPLVPVRGGLLLALLVFGVGSSVELLGLSRISVLATGGVWISVLRFSGCDEGLDSSLSPLVRMPTGSSKVSRSSLARVSVGSPEACSPSVRVSSVSTEASCSSLVRMSTDSSEVPRTSLVGVSVSSPEAYSPSVRVPTGSEAVCWFIGGITHFLGEGVC